LTDGTNIKLTEFENSVKKTLKPASGELRNKLIKLESKADWELISGRNIIGMIEGEDPSQIVVVGGHYDHLGKFGGYIYNGSDDNASGTVAVLEIAKACLATGVKPARTIVFALDQITS
jgi:Zn-dependent M28 family amino/carboxypeptidase